MKGLLQSVFGKNRLNIFEEESVEEVHPDSYLESPGGNKNNVFHQNELYYQKCIKLESRVSRLEKVNKYLVQQVACLTRELSKPSRHGISRASSYSRRTNSKKKDELNVYSSQLTNSDLEDEAQINPDHFLTNLKTTIYSSFDAFNLILEDSKSLQSLSNRIIGYQFDLESHLESGKELEVLSIVLETSVLALATLMRSENSISKSNQKRLHSWNNREEHRANAGRSREASRRKKSESISSLFSDASSEKDGGDPGDGSSNSRYKSLGVC